MTIRLIIAILLLPTVLAAHPPCPLAVAVSRVKPSIWTSRKVPVLNPTQKFAVDMLRNEFTVSVARTRTAVVKFGELSPEHLAAAEENLTIASNLLKIYGEKVDLAPVLLVATNEGERQIHGLRIEANPDLPLGEFAQQLGTGRMIYFPFVMHRMEGGYNHDTEILMLSHLAVLLGRVTPVELHELAHRVIDVMRDDGKPSLFHGAVRSTDGKPMELPYLEARSIDDSAKIAYLTNTDLSELYTFADEYREMGDEYAHATGTSFLLGLADQEPMADAAWFVREIYQNSSPRLTATIIAEAAELFRTTLADPQKWQGAAPKFTFNKLANPNAPGLKLTVAMRVKNVEVELDFVGPGIARFRDRFLPVAKQPDSREYQAVIREAVDAYLARLATLESLAVRARSEYEKLKKTTAPDATDETEMMMLSFGLAAPHERVTPYLHHASAIE